MQDAKEEVRARLAIEDIIGEYVELKRAGRNFKGLSPFTGEKTPSFYVSPDKNIWHDFSSNKGGDIFSFVMEVEGMDFREALEHLARKANVDLSMYQTARHKNIAAKKKRLLEANEAAAHYFQYCMLHNKTAIEYIFKKRKITKETAGVFRLGYAPDSGRALVEYLAKKGFGPQELREAGLVNRFGGDLFKGRMMVPLMDGIGQVIGFTGRIIIDDPTAPKYLNTPQTLLYDKSWHVFGLSQAKEAIRQHDYAVVVEGNLDVISSWQAGVKQTVATAGTAMTIHHLKTLGRLSPNIRLSFDGDRAGVAATERAIPIAVDANVELTIISLPEGAKDPDELINNNPALWQSAIDSTEPVVEWILHQYQKRHDVASAAGKRAYSTAGLALIAQLKDPVEQEHYLQYMSSVTSTSLDSLKAKMSRSKQSDKKPLKAIKSHDHTAVEASYPLEDKVLALGLAYPGLRELFREVEADYFHEDQRLAILNFIKSSSDLVQETPKPLQKYDNYVKMLLLRADARYSGWNDTDRLHETASLLRRIEVEHKKQQIVQLTERLRDAESLGNDSQVRQLMHQIVSLNKEINS